MTSSFTRDASQPCKDWPWELTMDPILGASKNPVWLTIQNSLKALDQKWDSFVILEQKDPEDPRRYWYIQSAVALQGVHEGRYALEIGYKGEDGLGHMLDRSFTQLEDLYPWYEAAFTAQRLDLSGFQDMSDIEQ